MSAATLPPPPATHPPEPPTSPNPEPLPVAVLPGDDLTRFILYNPPPQNLSSSGKHNRKSKKSRKQTENQQNENSDDDDDVAERNKLPPKLGTGLSCIYTAASSGAGTNSVPSLKIQATIAGKLQYRLSSRTWFIASNPRRYHLSTSASSLSPFPIAINSGSSNNSNKKSSISNAMNMGVGDRVIGIIEDQKASADYYRVQIFGSHPALLHVLNFEGATKRNRPQLEPGCLIFCRVIKSFGGGRMDPEVSCKVGGGSASTGGSGKAAVGYDDDGGASRKDWLTNEGTYGPLYGGTSFRVSLGLARELLSPKSVVLAALDQSGVPFEIAVGVNGMVWVNSSEAGYMIMILNAIKNSEVMTKEQIRGMVKMMVKNVKKQFED
mmetsp:Transcript_27235/g.56270  ORF Transcript_27235/g.56270 Transcript_27235/m.56270 type:complete len:380 (-) Transcript_27235:128-1267(-)